MAIFQDRSVNALNLHGIVITMLMVMMGLFGPTYALTDGLSVSALFLYSALFFLVRIIVRPIAMPLLQGKSLRFGAALGTAGITAALSLLAMSKGADGWLLAYVLLLAAMESIYWPHFHSIYAICGNSSHRGKRYAARAIGGLGGGIVIVLAGGYLIEEAGHRAYFASSLPLAALALWLLRRIPNELGAQEFHRRASRPPKEAMQVIGRACLSYGNRISIAANAHFRVVEYLWLVIVFLTVGELGTFVGVMIFGLIVQSVAIAYYGNGFDRGQRHRLNHACLGLGLLCLAGVMLLPLSLSVILALELLISLTRVTMDVLAAATVYNDAADQPHYSLKDYWFAHESSFDVMAGFLFATIGLATGLGAPLEAMMLLSLPGLLYFWQLFASRHRLPQPIRPAL